MRKTLPQIKHIPEPKELYDKLMESPGWQYKTNITKFHCRDRALVAILYLADLRIIEVLPLIKDNFVEKPNFVLVRDIVVGKKRQGKIEYREAKLPLKGERKVFTDLILQYLEYLEPNERLFPWSLERIRVPIKNSQYKLKDGTIINEPGYIMPDSWVDDRVAEKIKEKYNANDREMFLVNAVKKANGKNISAKKQKEFDDFDVWREECIAWGQSQKAIYAERKANVLEEIFD